MHGSLSYHAWPFRTQMRLRRDKLKLTTTLREALSA